MIVPDHVRETFEPESTCHGEDAPDGRGLRYLEWKWDPDPRDTTFEVAYAYLMREANGSTHVDSDQHLEGLFPRAAWLAWIHDAGFDAASRMDPWNRDVFNGRKLGP